LVRAVLEQPDKLTDRTAAILLSPQLHQVVVGAAVIILVALRRDLEEMVVLVVAVDLVQVD